MEVTKYEYLEYLLSSYENKFNLIFNEELVYKDKIKKYLNKLLGMVPIDTLSEHTQVWDDWEDKESIEGRIHRTYSTYPLWEQITHIQDFFVDDAQLLAKSYILIILNIVTIQNRLVEKLD